MMMIVQLVERKIIQNFPNISDKELRIRLDIVRELLKKIAPEGDSSAMNQGFNNMNTG